MGVAAVEENRSKMTDKTTRGLANASDEGLTTTNVVVGSTSLSSFNWRIAVALLLGSILWMAPYIASTGVLMPARVAAVAPDDRIAVVTTLNVLGAALALGANIVFGALSDITRSWLGRRVPWMLGGSLVSAVALAAFAFASDIISMAVAWSVYILGLNAIIAPMIAVISDRVPPKYRGTVSSIYGVGITTGAAVSQIVAAGFVSAPATGILIFAVSSFLSAIAFIVFAPRESNVGEERVALNWREIAKTFRFPVRGARDFYFALFGKFFLQAGGYAIANFQLYILLDYILLDEGEAAGVIALSGVLTLITGILLGLTSGPLSDKVGKRKPFVIGAALLVAVGIAFPMFAPFAWAMIAYAAIAGIGNGVYGSVDQALNIEVLPDPDSAAKDLGILNLANTGGQITGPLVSSVIVATTGGYQGVFVGAFAMLVVSALLIIPIRSVK